MVHTNRLHEERGSFKSRAQGRLDVNRSLEHGWQHIQKGVDLIMSEQKRK
jgi:hypothetical protein